MKERIGVVFIALALSTTGVKPMLVPMAFMAIGIWLVREVIEW